LEIVLTAHPTQIVRRTLQYKLANIASLLDENDRQFFLSGIPLISGYRHDLRAEKKDQVIEGLVREITALWQTEEFRSKDPTPADGDASLI